MTITRIVGDHHREGIRHVFTLLWVTGNSYNPGRARVYIMRAGTSLTKQCHTLAVVKSDDKWDHCSYKDI